MKIIYKSHNHSKPLKGFRGQTTNEKTSLQEHPWRLSEKGNTMIFEPRLLPITRLRAQEGGGSLLRLQPKNAGIPHPPEQDHKPPHPSAPTKGFLPGRSRTLVLLTPPRRPAWCKGHILGKCGRGGVPGSTHPPLRDWTLSPWQRMLNSEALLWGSTSKVERTRLPPTPHQVRSSLRRDVTQRSLPLSLP